ncbi:MAG: hypothetical protein LUG83_02820 [Lachnospiraceae bacterium]|nr:hypothetical protein [Lachnospiraceae bacterium]
MNVKELKNILVKCGVPKELYNFEETGRRDERFCIKFVDDKWNVFYTEKDCKTTNLFFDTEDEACLYLYNELRR